MKKRLTCSAGMALLLTWLCACSVLVDPESLAIKCEVEPGREGEDPCLSAGLHCIDSECKPCRTGGDNQEKCNGIDDDCDGVVDEDADQDGDGFTWCGGGLLELVDCAPDDAKIHPARAASPSMVAIAAPKDVCDGKDNDCDMKVDEDQSCASTRCMQDTDCVSPQRCDRTSGQCFAPRPVGTVCRSDADCNQGLCMKMDAYPLGVELADSRCVSACCSDLDCPEQSVCVVSDAGVRVCLPVSIAARGKRGLGDSCGSDAECSSGACIGGRCAQRCVTEAGCKSAACALSSGSPREARRFSCVESPLGREPAGSTCSAFDPTACRSGLCTGSNSCAKPCGRDADCGAEETCGHEQVRALLLGPSSVISYCERRTQTEDAGLCCTNAECAKGQLCAPKAIDGRSWTMTCR